ncbi:MAG TPA: cytochrome c biogenesis protein CcsA [Tepidisphaeraceae bacterium]|jgi:cytochrome c-type biogenesis protein CcsB|nr:cytochrome c biogenesis protein CcsA [Tepidisphaeraceae bacterium]
MFRYIVPTLLVLLAIVRPALADDFAKQLKLDEIRKITVQDRQTLKTLDTFARQALSTITGKSKLDGQDAVYTVLDMASRPELYTGRNLIKIKNVPLRQDFMRLKNLPADERQRIVEEGTISLEFWTSAEVGQLMRSLQSEAIFKANAIGQVNQAAGTLQNLTQNIAVIGLIPPPPGAAGDKKWRGFGEVSGNVAVWNELAKADGRTAPPAVAGYDDQLVGEAAMRLVRVLVMWQKQDAAAVNEEFGHLAEVLPAINPTAYPSPLNRKVEIVYNKLAKLTIPGAFLYFGAFVCFLVSARSGLNGVRLWGLRLFLLAFAVHTVGIGIRWWLVASQHGSWFDGIPIKNQFESVLFSAWFGALIGLYFEMRRSRAIFGAAASFVGWLSLVAIFATPYVTGVEIGGEIGHVAGVLMSYWLYLHVTLVVASYALIAMGFALSIWWLVGYYRNYGTLNREPARRLSADVVDLDDLPVMGASGGAMQLGFARTLAMMLFVPGARPAATRSQAAVVTTEDVESPSAGAKFLATLDACNLVILQLAFWVLGVGIILGAVWADQSWGRPWGWDPKETFALVTWIVYLVVVHVRVATVHKAWWTAILSIVGFFVMLFNWIGVNFFLVGLHSYA